MRWILLLTAAVAGIAMGRYMLQPTPVAGEVFICPLTGEELPCPRCCPLAK